MHFNTVEIDNDSVAANIFDSTKPLFLLSVILLSRVHCVHICIYKYIYKYGRYIFFSTTFSDVFTNIVLIIHGYIWFTASVIHELCKLDAW